MIGFAFQDSPKQRSGKWLVQAVPKDCEIFMQSMRSYNTSYHLKVVAHGGTFYIYFNNGGSPVLSIHNNALNYGTLGLYANGGTAVFQNANVTYSPTNFSTNLSTP